MIYHVASDIPDSQFFALKVQCTIQGLRAAPLKIWGTKYIYIYAYTSHFFLLFPHTQ